MTTTTVELHDVQTQWLELIQLVRAGNEVLLTEAQKPVMRRVPITNGGKPRTAGLGWMRDDFDAALPDSFWGDANLRLTGC